MKICQKRKDKSIKKNEDITVSQKVLRHQPLTI